MYKFVLIGLLVSLYGLPAYGQSLEVLGVKENSKEVVLLDKDTGLESVAKQGQKVGVWRVVEITRDHVTLARLEGDTVFVTTIPIPAKQRIIIEVPK